MGEGAFATFFRIRGYPKLGVKISRLERPNMAKKILQEELNKAKILMELKLPVPKYVEVIQIQVPEYFIKTLDRGITRNNPDSINNDVWIKESREEIITTLKKTVVYGLLMEYVEPDLSLISQKRLEYIYKKEVAKIEKYGIKIIDSGLHHNVLWSKSQAKMYFIDVEAWDLSEMHNPVTEKKSWWRKLFE